MDIVAAGFWGAYFGTVGLMLAGAVAALARSLHRVALNAALSGVTSALFAIAYLGLLPISQPHWKWRVIAHISVLFAVVLSVMLVSMLGLMRERAARRALRWKVAAPAGAVLAAGWALSAEQSLLLSSAAVFLNGTVLLLVCLRRAQHGYRLAWLAVVGAASLMVAVAGLTVIATASGALPWWAHAATALAGMVYLTTMAAALWARYSYLVELREIVAHGPTYDPITRMRTHAETGQMVGLAFFSQKLGDTKPVGVIAISIGNLMSLKALHGQTALNHGLFVCASRLRRCVPAEVQMGRLGEDGFLLVLRNAGDPAKLLELGHLLVQRLARPVVLSTDLSDLEKGQADWVAQVGVGIVNTTAEERPSLAVASARAMSRTAWSYPSRVASHSETTGAVADALKPASV